MEIAGQYISVGVIVFGAPIAIGLAIALVVTLLGAWRGNG